MVPGLHLNYTSVIFAPGDALPPAAVPVTLTAAERKTLKKRVRGGENALAVPAAGDRGYTFSEAVAVFECSGARAIPELAITNIVRSGGTVAMVGLFEDSVSFDPNPLVRKEVTVVGSYAYERSNWEEAFRLLSEHRVDVRPLVTHTFPLSQINEAFATQLDKELSIKVAVVPDT